MYKKLFLSLIVIQFCFFAATEDKWSSGAINVRTAPGANYDVMGQLYKNEQVEVFDEKKDGHRYFSVPEKEN
jgi:uncharacterized protein YgiM (DUF1202 family)